MMNLQYWVTELGGGGVGCWGDRERDGGWGSSVGETEKRSFSAGETERNKSSMPGCKMGGGGRSSVGETETERKEFLGVGDTQREKRIFNAGL